MKCEVVDHWNEYLEDLPIEQRDIYFREEYIRLYEDDEGIGKCVICSDDNNVLLMPFIRRDIRRYYDFETAYGYGGLISNANDDWVSLALALIHEFLRSQNYVCGFTRFHPLIDNGKRVASILSSNEKNGKIKDIQVFYDRKTIAIDTSQEPDQIWSTQIISKNRNMIRKAEKNGLKYKSEFDFSSMYEFKNLYLETMKRLDAESFYFFGKNYFDKFVDTMRDKTFLGTVRKDGKLICGALFMYDGIYGHYHLEGSDRNYSSLGANNLLLWKAACEMHRLGVKQFHLGGGYDAKEDNSLLKFKRAFSSNMKDFYIGRQIFNIDAYKEICKRWEDDNQEKITLYGNRLLKYRY